MIIIKNYILLQSHVDEELKKKKSIGKNSFFFLNLNRNISKLFIVSAIIIIIIIVIIVITTLIVLECF
jgi:hypothetical protein